MTRAGMTPGEWKALAPAFYVGEPEVTRIVASGIVVAECRAYCADERSMVAENARLIASAPALLAALEDVEDYLDGEDRMDQPMTEEERGLLVQIRAAMDAARGGEGGRDA